MVTGVQQIGYGMLTMPFHPPVKPVSLGYHEGLELIVLAQGLVFNKVVSGRKSVGVK